jgi:NAD kinase
MPWEAAMAVNSPPTDWQTFAIHAQREQKFEEMKTRVENLGLLYQPNSPDCIITVGGDGTFLQA